MVRIRIYMELCYQQDVHVYRKHLTGKHNVQCTLTTKVVLEKKNITRKQLDRFIIIIYRKYNYISMYLESTKYFTNISLGRKQISS